MGEGGPEETEGAPLPQPDVLRILSGRSHTVQDAMAARTAFDANLLHLHLHFTAFTPGVDHARRVLRDMSQWAANPALGLLPARAEDNARRCYVAILSNDGATVNDICRDFMEMEVLLADFRRDPTSLDRWSSLPRRRRSDEYKFNKLLNRVGRIGVFRRPCAIRWPRSTKRTRKDSTPPRRVASRPCGPSDPHHAVGCRLY